MKLFFILFTSFITTLLLLLLPQFIAKSIFVSSAAAGVPGKGYFPYLSPSGREDFGMTCTDTDTEATTGQALQLWIVGGTGSTGLNNDVWSYDTSRRTWEKKNSEKFDSQQIAFTLLASDAGTGDGVELLAIGGKEFSTNAPTDQVQAFRGSAWSSVDATAASGGSARSARSYWSGSWFTNDQFGSQQTDIWFVGGVHDDGFNKNAFRLTLNRTRGAHSASWTDPMIKVVGVEGTDHPVPSFGQCCATDPTRPLLRRAVCFGGSNFLNDTNQIYFVRYGSGAPYYVLKSTIGPAPFPRRLAACSFVGQDKFVVYGGFDSYKGGAINDKKTYILNLTVDPPVWSTIDNHPSLRPAFSAKMSSCFYANATFKTYLFGGNLGDVTYASGLYVWSGVGAVGFVPESLAQTASATDSIPIGRAFHNAVVFRASVVIFNGQDENDNLLNDIWMYNTISRSWTYLSGGLLGTWTPRFMAGSEMISGVIVMYGGFASSDYSATVRDLVEVDIQTGAVEVTSDTGNPNAPGGRAAFGSFVQNNIMVVSGGKGDGFVTKSSFHGYNVVSQSWSPLYYYGNKTLHSYYDIVFRRYGHCAIAYNSTHALYGLGFAFDSKFDMYWIRNVNTDALSFEAVSISTGFLVSGTRRDYIRGFGGYLVSGSYLFVCGGMSTIGLSAPRHAACYILDLVNEAWFTLGGDSTSFLISGQTVAYIGRTLYIVGGYKSNSVAIVRNTYQDVIKFVFDLSAICKATRLECIMCSPGSTADANGECIFAGQGQYVADPISGPVNCSAGTALGGVGSRTATECTPCKFGFYNPNPGSSSCLPCPSNSICPVGAASALAANSPRALLITNVPSASESHPAAFGSLPVPWFPILMVVAAFSFAVLLVLFVLVVGWLSRRRRVSYYIPGDKIDDLEQLYTRYATARYGMSEADLMACLVAERDSLLPSHDIDPLTAHRIYATVDRHRAGYMKSNQFVDCVILAISTGWMLPFANTPAVTQPKLHTGKIVAMVSSLELADLDYFDDQHQNAELGESNRLVKNWYGGVVSLLMIVLMVGLVMAIVLDFLLNNVLETKTAVPRAVIYSIFSDAGKMQVAAPFTAHVTVFGLLRASQGIATLREACVKAGTTSTCATATATPLGIETPDSKSPLTRLECSYDARQESCSISWFCERCSVNEGAGGGNVSFTLSPAYASPVVRVRVQVGTGLREATQGTFGEIDVAGGAQLFSTSDSYARPVSNQTVFSGYPATTFSYALTNTFFEAQNYGSLVGMGDTFLDTGYHIRMTSNPSPGSSVSPEFFEKKFDVPVTVTFTVDSTPVLVKRALIQSIVELLSSLLGAMSGLAGMIVIALQFFDGLGENDNFDENADALRDKLDDGDGGKNEKRNNNSEQKRKYQEDDDDNDNGEKIEMGSPRSTGHKRKNRAAPIATNITSRAEFSKLQNLLKAGVSLSQAEAIIKVIDIAMNPETASPLPVSTLGGDDEYDECGDEQQQRQQQRFSGPPHPTTVVNVQSATTSAEN